MVPGVENGIESVVEREDPTSCKIAEPWGIPVAERKKKVGRFIFQAGYCVGDGNSIFFCQTIHHGLEWAAGGITWNGPHLRLKKFA